MPLVCKEQVLMIGERNIWHFSPGKSCFKPKPSWNDSSNDTPMRDCWIGSGERLNEKVELFDLPPKSFLLQAFFTLLNIQSMQKKQCTF